MGREKDLVYVLKHAIDWREQQGKIKSLSGGKKSCFIVELGVEAEWGKAGLGELETQRMTGGGFAKNPLL